jgi:TrmH family RNA methyltransferase
VIKPKLISSRENPFFKELLKLSGSSRSRRKCGQTLLDGIHLVESYMAAGFTPLNLLVTNAALEGREIKALLKRAVNVPVTELSDALFAELTELKTMSGIIALIEEIKPAVPVKACRFGLLLEDIQDPGNLGSILRTAAGAGADAVFLSKGCADAWSPKVLRAAMGGHFALSLHESADLLAVAQTFEGALIATVPRAEKSLYACDLTGKIAFMIGNEGAGLSDVLLGMATERITIPMPGKVESLNAAAAAAVCLFEAVRRRAVEGSG